MGSSGRLLRPKAVWEWVLIGVSAVALLVMLAVLQTEAEGLFRNRSHTAQLIFTLIPAAILTGAVLSVASRANGENVPAQRGHRYFLVGLAFVAVEGGLLLVAWLGARSLLSDLQDHAHFGPGEATAIVGSVTALTTAIGTLTGAILLGLSRLTRARGYADAERTRADAEMVRAQAELERAKSERAQIDGSHKAGGLTLPSRSTRKGR